MIKDDYQVIDVCGPNVGARGPGNEGFWSQFSSMPHWARVFLIVSRHDQKHFLIVSKQVCI